MEGLGNKFAKVFSIVDFCFCTAWCRFLFLYTSCKRITQMFFIRLRPRISTGWFITLILWDLKHSIMQWEVSIYPLSWWNILKYPLGPLRISLSYHKRLTRVFLYFCEICLSFEWQRDKYIAAKISPCHKRITIFCLLYMFFGS